MPRRKIDLCTLERLQESSARVRSLGGSDVLVDVDSLDALLAAVTSMLDRRREQDKRRRAEVTSAARADRTRAAVEHSKERAREAARRALRSGARTTAKAIAQSVGISATAVREAIVEAGLAHALEGHDGISGIGRRRKQR